MRQINFLSWFWVPFEWISSKFKSHTAQSAVQPMWFAGNWSTLKVALYLGNKASYCWTSFSIQGVFLKIYSLQLVQIPYKPCRFVRVLLILEGTFLSSAVPVCWGSYISTVVTHEGGMLSALHTGRLYPIHIDLVPISVGGWDDKGVSFWPEGTSK